MKVQLSSEKLMVDLDFVQHGNEILVIHDSKVIATLDTPKA